MVELIVDRLKCRFQVREIHDPSGVGADRAANVDFNPERVAVQSKALMVRRDIWEAVRCFN